MTLTYSELMDLCSLDKGLRYWNLAYPCHENGLGIRVLRESWQFISAAQLQADSQFSSMIQVIIERRGKEATRP